MEPGVSNQKVSEAYLYCFPVLRVITSVFLRMSLNF